MRRQSEFIQALMDDIAASFSNHKPQQHEKLNLALPWRSPSTGRRKTTWQYLR